MVEQFASPTSTAFQVEHFCFGCAFRGQEAKQENAQFFR
jgi:hypothetical protein